jgi:hypothetical protein
MASKYMQNLTQTLQAAGADQTAIPQAAKAAPAEPVAPQSRQQAEPSSGMSVKEAAEKFASQQPASNSGVSTATANLLKKIAIKDDFGDDVEVEVDFSNDDKLREYVSAAHKTKHIESELEVLRSQLAAREAAEKALQSKYGKLFAASTAEEMADVALAERGGLEALVKQKIQEAEEFRKLPEDQQKELIRKQEDRAQQQKFEKMQKELDDKMKKIKEGEEKTQQDAVKTLYMQATAKYCPADTDNADLKKVNRIIWDEAHKELLALKQTGAVLTQAVVDQKFQKAFMNNKSLVTAAKGANVQTNSMVEATREQTGAANNSASSASSGINEAALIDKWFHLINAGRGGEVAKEVASNPKVLNPIYVKLAARYRR